MFNLVTQIFGLKIVERSTICEASIAQNIPNDDKPVEVWHKEVHFYDLFDSSENRLLGSFYADWHCAPVSVQEPG